MVCSIKNVYIEELGVKWRNEGEDTGEFSSLPVKKRGRQLLLGHQLDLKVQLYLKKVQEGGGALSARIVMAAAIDILLKCDRTKLAEYGGHVHLNRGWAHSLVGWMNFVQRKVTTAKSKQSTAEFAELKENFLADVVATVTMEEIPLELILNWDQTGIKMVPCSTWPMEQQGAKREEVIGVNDKRRITAVFCGSLIGDFLPIQVIIYKGKTPRCHPQFEFPLEWNITHSPKHWSNEQTMLEYIEHIILPYI